MVDTLVLCIEDGDYKIEDHSKFSPSTKNLFEPPYYPLGQNSCFTCKSNDMKSSEYYPTITVVKRYFPNFRESRTNLYVQFSAPKIIFGNNVDEVSQEDFYNVCASLYVKLRHMGVVLNSIDSLADTKVTRVHFSKNIIFRDYTTASMVINHLKKTDVSHVLDINEVKYKNGGSALYFHSTAYEFVLYDKLKEMQTLVKKPKRSAEIDRFISDIKLPDIKPLDILRLEARINEKWKLNSIFKELDICYSKNFQNMFNPEISNKVLHFYWKLITKGLFFLKSEDLTVNELLEKIRIENPDLNISKSLSICAFYLALREADGNYRRLRKILALDGSKGSAQWSRLKKDLEILNLIEAPDLDLIENVSNKLDTFECVRIDKLND